MKSINQERDELTELTGCESWEQVVEWFKGMTIEQIESECDKCWTYEDNEDLAHRLYEAID